MPLRHCFVRTGKSCFWLAGVAVILIVAGTWDAIYLFGVSIERVIAVTVAIVLIVLAGAIGILIGGKIAPPVSTDSWFKTYQPFVVGLIAPTLTLSATLCAALLAWTAVQHQIEKQQEIFQAQQRPWVKVSVETAGPLRFIQNGPGTMPLNITLTNVGNSPALNIRPALWSFLASPTHKDIHAEWKQRCDRLRMEPLDNPGRGFVLFPGEGTTLENAGLGGLSSIAILPNEIAQNLVETDGKKTIDLSFYGCVDYVFSFREEHHQTGFAFRIRRKIDGGLPGAVTFSIEPVGSIPQDRLMLQSSPSASGRTD